MSKLLAFTDLGSCTETRKSIFYGKISCHTVICPGLGLTLYWFAEARHLLRGGLVLDLLAYFYHSWPVRLIFIQLFPRIQTLLVEEKYLDLLELQLQSYWQCFAKRSFSPNDPFFLPRDLLGKFLVLYLHETHLLNYSKEWISSQ